MAEAAPGPTDSGLLAVFTTVADATQAQMLADAAVNQGLAACVQAEAIHSTYRWDGELQHEAEWRLMFKTSAPAYPALEQLLRRLHPYELPAIFALPVAAASPAYADWVQQAVAAEAAQDRA